MSDLRIRSSVLCIQDGHILALKYQDDSGDSFWGVPGGEIEDCETPLNAALRETKEETGYEVEVLCDPALCIDYHFHWKDKAYHCRTHWFGVQPIQGIDHPCFAGDEDYITELRWIPVDQWQTILAGHSEIQAAMGKLITQMQREGKLSG